MSELMSTQVNEKSTEKRKPIFEMRNITKRFPGVTALDDVTFEVYAGEVHALVGENGAGKSTLMKILAGAYQADEGTILLDGKKVSFMHPREAQEKGISIIYQEFNLLPDRTVAQNIFVGREPVRFGLVDQNEMNRRTAELLRQLGVENLFTPTSMVRDLSVAEQQLVEIAKALSFESKVLVMDEPTAALSTAEVEVLFNLVKTLQARSLAVVYISHRMKEIFDLAQQVTVLKDGQKVATASVKELSSGDIVRMMVGRELNDYFPPRATPEEIKAPMLTLKNAGNDYLHDIDLEIRAGEIVGVSGLQGSGRSSLAQAIFGENPFTCGEMTVDGKKVQVTSPFQAIHLDIGFLTEDRKREGILGQQSIRDNILLAYRGMQNLLNIAVDRDLKGLPQVTQLAEKVDVRASGLDKRVNQLSGGNQQKVVLAKWLAAGSRVFIFDEPTRGIDVNAKASIHLLIRELARTGAAVLMISSELPEVIGMSDRIIVMREGTIIGELAGGASEAEVMLLATGEHEKRGKEILE